MQYIHDHGGFADVPFERIVEACRMAEIHDTIEALPQATRRRSASTAWGSREGSASGSRLRARS
jgi:ABC-type multidrug transport system fused ATPase/permease subunit